ncbi:MAG: hypothetical protein QOG58_4127 [Caballeronia sp.]|jgi:hypothetical protein|nr:hypothetical protein [Caballeronia sp.]
MRASSIASAVPFSGHYCDKKHYQEHHDEHACPVVLLKLALTHGAHHLIERVIPVAV